MHDGIYHVGMITYNDMFRLMVRPGVIDYWQTRIGDDWFNGIRPPDPDCPIVDDKEALAEINAIPQNDLGLIPNTEANRILFFRCVPELYADVCQRMEDPATFARYDRNAVAQSN